MVKKQSKLIIISGPSGAGEDSIIDGLGKNGFNIERVITTTTRNMRQSEKQGSPYYFISKKEFEKLIKEKKFVEWAKVYENYYGCTFEELKRVEDSGKIGIWKIDYQGVITVKKILKDKMISIYIKPPSLGIAVKRLEGRRQDSSAEIKKRVEFTKNWLNPENDKIYDYIVVNEEGKLDKAIKEVQAIIKKRLIGSSKVYCFLDFLRKKITTNFSK